MCAVPSDSAAAFGLDYPPAPSFGAVTLRPQFGGPQSVTVYGLGAPISLKPPSMGLG